MKREELRDLKTGDELVVIYDFTKYKVGDKLYFYKYYKYDNVLFLTENKFKNLVTSIPVHDFNPSICCHFEPTSKIRDTKISELLQ